MHTNDFPHSNGWITVSLLYEKLNRGVLCHALKTTSYRPGRKNREKEEGGHMDEKRGKNDQKKTLVESRKKGEWGSVNSF